MAISNSTTSTDKANKELTAHADEQHERGNDSTKTKMTVTMDSQITQNQMTMLGENMGAIAKGGSAFTIT